MTLKKIISALIIITCLTSCGDNEPVYSGVPPIVQDNASVLSTALTDSIMNIDNAGIPLIVMTVDTLDMSNLNSQLDTLLTRQEGIIEGFASKGVLVAGVKSNNTCYIKYGTCYDGLSQTPVEYSSESYYLTQLNDSMPISDKVYAMALCAVDGAKRNNEAYLSQILCGELLGPLFNIVSPGDGVLYRYIIHPLQYPIIKMIDLTGSLYWGLLLFGIAAFIVLAAVKSIVVKLTFPALARSAKNKKDMLMQANAVIGAVYLIFWTVPWLIGAVSLASVFSFSGLETVQDIHHYLGISYGTIHNINMSSASSTSLLLVILTIGVVDMSISQGFMSKIKGYALLVFTVFTTAGINYAILLYALPHAIANYKDKYLDNRVQGLGKTESSLWPLFNAACVIIGILIGVGVAQGFDHLTGSKNNTISKIPHTDIRDLGQVLPLAEPVQASTNVSDYMTIVTPLHQVSTKGNRAQYSMTVDNLRDLDDVILVFGTESSRYKGHTVEHKEHIPAGIQEITIEYHTGEGDTRVTSLTSIAAEDPSLTDRIKVEDKGLFNTSDHPVIVSAKIKSSGTTDQYYLYLAPRSSVQFQEPVEVMDVRTYRQ